MHTPLHSALACHLGHDSRVHAHTTNLSYPLLCARRSTAVAPVSEEAAITEAKAALALVFSCISEHGRNLLENSGSREKWVGYDRLTKSLIKEAAATADAIANNSLTSDKKAILARITHAKSVLRQYKSMQEHPTGHRLFHLLVGQSKALATNRQ